MTNLYLFYQIHDFLTPRYIPILSYIQYFQAEIYTFFIKYIIFLQAKLDWEKVSHDNWTILDGRVHHKYYSPLKEQIAEGYFIPERAPKLGG